jgi:hypothetical protein
LVVAAMIRFPLTSPTVAGVNATLIVQELPGPGVVQVPIVAENPDGTANWLLVIWSRVVVESAVTVSVCAAVVTLTKVVPKASDGPPLTVAVCPKAATAARGRI